MDKSSRNAYYSREMIETLATKLQALEPPSKAKQQMTKKDAIAALKSELIGLKKRDTG